MSVEPPWSYESIIQDISAVGRSQHYNMIPAAHACGETRAKNRRDGICYCRAPIPLCKGTAGVGRRKPQPKVSGHEADKLQTFASCYLGMLAWKEILHHSGQAIPIFLY